MNPNSLAPPVLEMQGVSVGAMRDPESVAVENVNWTVHAGDYWVISGLLGTGKSDFLLLTGGLMAPRRGHYRLFGEEMPIFEERRLKERLRLGFVFEGGHLLNHLTIRENIALPLHYHLNLTPAEVEAVVEPLLEATQLAAVSACTPGSLGRTWQKRAGLARALALKPEILLVDNPLGGLDLRQERWWLGFLGQLSRGHALLQGRPLTLIATAADLRPWKDHARQFAILRDRRLLVLGTWAQAERVNAELVGEMVTTFPAGQQQQVEIGPETPKKPQKQC